MTNAPRRVPTSHDYFNGVDNAALEWARYELDRWYKLSSHDTPLVVCTWSGEPIWYNTIAQYDTLTHKKGEEYLESIDGAIIIDRITCPIDKAQEVIKKITHISNKTNLDVVIKISYLLPQLIDMMLENGFRPNSCGEYDTCGNVILVYKHRNVELQYASKTSLWYTTDEASQRFSILIDLFESDANIKKPSDLIPFTYEIFSVTNENLHITDFNSIDTDAILETMSVLVEWATVLAFSISISSDILMCGSLKSGLMRLGFGLSADHAGFRPFCANVSHVFDNSRHGWLSSNRSYLPTGFYNLFKNVGSRDIYHLILIDRGLVRGGDE